MKNLTQFLFRPAMLVAILGIILSVILVTQCRTISKLKTTIQKKDQAAKDQATEFETYNLKNSERVATEAFSRNMELEEFKKLRAEDLKTIEQLRTRKRDIQTVTKIEFLHSDTIRVPVIQKETITKNIRDTLNCLKIDSEYLKLDICEKGGIFTGSYSVFDKITIVETVKKKRFLGFLWKTKRIKNRKIDIISDNPKMKITGVEHLKIEE